MQIIDKIYVSGFRSLGLVEWQPIGSMTCIAGKNNTGKSNILRAISAFFTGEVEPNNPIEILRDCSITGKKQKIIRIGIKFRISETIKFPKRLTKTEKTIGRDAEIIKEYHLPSGGRIGIIVNVILNKHEASIEENEEIEKFLSLFNFRYITSDRTPQRVLEDNLDELRAELKYQLNKRNKANKNIKGIDSDAEKAIKTISKLSDDIFRPIVDEIVAPGNNIKSVRISTPKEIVDLISMARYQFTTEEGLMLSEKTQGHGIQNSLLFFVLYLIDRNFHRKFGWKVATIWLLEEPETYLHHELKVKLANYLQVKTKDKDERFQIIFSTHCEVFPQYSNSHLMVSMIKRQDSLSTQLTPFEKHSFIQHLNKERVTTVVSTTALYSDRRIVIVEGLYDEIVIKKLMARYDLENIEVFSINRYIGQHRGGESKMRALIDGNIDIINQRDPRFPILFLFDWDVTDPLKPKKFTAGSRAVKPSPKKANPKLGNDWKGIERYYTNDIIENCSAFIDGIIKKNTRGRYIFDNCDYDSIKKSIYEYIKDRPIDEKHFSEIVGFLKQLHQDKP